MFLELMPVLEKRDLLITVSRIEENVLRVVVLPKLTRADENQALATPLCYTGSPAEIDAELPQHLSTYAEKHAALGSTLAEAIAEMEAASKAKREEARKKRTPNSPTTAGVPLSTNAPAMANPSPRTLSLFENPAETSQGKETAKGA